MTLDIAGWLIDSETEHARMSIGPKWPGGHYAESLVTMIDAQNAIRSAVAAERERGARKPLTDGEVLKMWRATDFRGNGGQADWFAEGIRAAERAHGIGA